MFILKFSVFWTSLFPLCGLTLLFTFLVIVPMIEGFTQPRFPLRLSKPNLVIFFLAIFINFGFSPKFGKFWNKKIPHTVTTNKIIRNLHENWIPYTRHMAPSPFPKYSRSFRHLSCHLLLLPKNYIASTPLPPERCLFGKTKKQS